MSTTKAFLFILSALTAVGCATAKPEAAASAPRVVVADRAPDGTVGANAQTVAATLPAQTPASDAVVRELYRQHDADRSPFFQSKDRARVDKYFAKATADLIWKDTTKGTAVLNADPLYNSHDPEPKNFAVGRPKIENDTATVVVTFVNYGVKETVTYRLVKEDAAWKIADIEYKDGSSLLKMFKGDFYRVDEQEQEHPTTNEADDEFEGRYQVGETTCTVKPVKMAYEVRWAKGSGAMLFFGEEKKRFVSEERAEGRDAFVFDDDSLSTGTFIRADGKKVAVRRME
jgi:uncharacterized protein DUF3828